MHLATGTSCPMLLDQVFEPMLAAVQNCTDVADENGTLNDLVAAGCWV
jgi:hypothetical protein